MPPETSTPSFVDKQGFDESRLLPVTPVAAERNVHSEDAVVVRSAHMEVRLRGLAHRRQMPFRKLKQGHFSLGHFSI